VLGLLAWVGAVVAPSAAAAVPVVTATIHVGSDPQGVAVNRVTGTIYVANSDSNTVSVIGGPVTVKIGCPPPVLAFDVASGSSTLTEVSGPTLAPSEEFSYDGGIYTIMSVDPGANSFTVFRNNFLFVNSGPPITNGHGILLCSPPKSF
jgi:DNA-binding beta-propeller fold protein YncE